MAKRLARAGVASRREVERLIAAGRVALNGKVLASPALNVGEGDILTVDGAVVDAAEPTRLFRYHKPAGLVTTHVDPKGRPTVFAALPPGLPRVVSVGRLDLGSEGLLLLTNDGELSRALELPATAPQAPLPRPGARPDRPGASSMRSRTGSRSRASATARSRPASTRPRTVRRGANLWITLSLTEGKNREVRRVLEALGLAVNRLIRVAYGPFALGTLAPGAVEEVGPRVIREQLADLITPQNLPKGERAQFRPYEPAAARPRREPSAAKAKAAAPEKPVKVYKEGWARPKKRAVPKPGAVKPRRGSAPKG